jgi:AraC-like DNA-binding protein
MPKNIRISEYEQEQLLTLGRQMLERPGDDYQFAALSKTLGINRYKLSYGFRKVTGTSIHQFLISARMHYAKRLLLTTERSIKEIAGLSGYPDPSNFCTTFKKQVGITPGSFRKNKGC